MLGFIGGMASAVASSINTDKTNDTNMQLNRENIELAKEENAIERLRSDNAFQRKTEDLKKAGLSPLLATEGGLANANISVPQNGFGAISAPVPDFASVGSQAMARMLTNKQVDNQKEFNDKMADLKATEIGQRYEVELSKIETAVRQFEISDGTQRDLAKLQASVSRECASISASSANKDRASREKISEKQLKLSEEVYLRAHALEQERLKFDKAKNSAERSEASRSYNLARDQLNEAIRNNTWKNVNDSVDTAVDGATDIITSTKGFKFPRKK